MKENFHVNIHVNIYMNNHVRYEPQFSREYGLSTYPLGVSCWALVQK